MVVPLVKGMTEMLKAGWLWKTGQHLIKELIFFISYNNHTIIIFSWYVSSKDRLTKITDKQELNANGELKENQIVLIKSKAKFYTYKSNRRLNENWVIPQEVHPKCLVGLPTTEQFY